jgi:hypothetical protein
MPFLLSCKGSELIVNLLNKSYSLLSTVNISLTLIDTAK